MGSQVERAHSKVGGWRTSAGKALAGVGWRTGMSHICMQINREEQLGNDTDHTTQIPEQRNKASKPLTEKTCGG